MDYGYVLKRAWAVTWKHKILWLFGFFMMAGGANYSSSTSSYQSGMGGVTPEQFETMEYGYEQFMSWLPILIGIGIVLLVLAILWYVLLIAANGALIHLVNEAEERREVRARLGWKAGFHNWFRIFAIYFLLMLPLLLLGIVAAFALVIPLIGATSFEDAMATLLVSCCCVTLVAVVLGLIIGFFITVLGMLGTRYAVLDDIGPIDSLNKAWNDLRTQFKDVFLMWLISLGVGIAYGMVAGMIVMVFGIGIFMMMITGAMWAAVAVGFVMVLALLLPNAIYATYVSSMWTIFFRRMTGLDKPEVREAYQASGLPQPAGGYQPPPPATPGGYQPPPPPG